MDSELADLMREKAAFVRLLPDLLAQFPGQYAAIHGERVVATGPDQMDVIENAYAKVGTVPMCVGLVTDQIALPERIPAFADPPGRRSARDMNSSAS